MARNAAQVLRGLGKFVKVGNSADQRCETSRRAGQTGSSGEVVLGDDPERVGGELGERGVGILKGLAEGTKVGDTSKCALGRLDVLGAAVQVQGVRRWVFGRARSSGQGTERALRECD